MPDGSPVEGLKITHADVAAANGDVSPLGPQALEDKIVVNPPPPESDMPINITVGATKDVSPPSSDATVRVHVPPVAEPAARPADTAPVSTPQTLRVKPEIAAQPETVSRLSALIQRLRSSFPFGQRHNGIPVNPVNPPPATPPVDIRILSVNPTHQPDSAGPDIVVRPPGDVTRATAISPATEAGTVNGTAVLTEPVDAGPAPGTRAAGEAAAVAAAITVDRPSDAPPTALPHTEPAATTTAPRPKDAASVAFRPAETPPPPDAKPLPAADDHAPALPAEPTAEVAEIHSPAPEGDLQLSGFDTLQQKIDTDGVREFIEIRQIVNPISEDFVALVEDTDRDTISREIKRESSDNGPRAIYKLSTTNSNNTMTAAVSRGRAEVTESYGPEDQKISKTYLVVNETNDPYQKRFYVDGVEVTNSEEKQQLWNKFQNLTRSVILYATNMDTLQIKEQAAPEATPGQ